ncbi:MAG: DUF3293 domain-containing protein [Fimbriiglobus sp.]|nr:DUF3293 domain-containing protein [Fimbriiglobus sp.]
MAPDAQLDAAYRATHYRVHTEPPFVLQVGQGSAELDALLDRHGETTWAFITGCNPHSVQLSVQENAERWYKLRAVLRAILGGGVLYPGEGVDPAGVWPGEPSLLAVGMGRDAAKSVGREFEQNAILVGEKGGPAELVWLV